MRPPRPDGRAGSGRGRGRAAAVGAGLLLLAFCGRASAADVPLLLDVRINGYAIGKIGEVILRDGALLGRRGELEALGLNLPPAPGASADALVALSDIPGLGWRLDAAAQVLYLTAAANRLAPAVLKLSGYERPVPVQSGLGATLDYDLVATSASGRITGDGLADLRLFSPYGVASTGALAYVGPRAGAARGSLVRLDSTYAYSDPDRLLRVKVGDFVTSGPTWSRALRLGGVQLTSDYSLRPDLVTFPLPSLAGSVTVPTTLNVLVNGARAYDGEVGPGPFQIPRLPIAIGAGSIDMILTDALGHSVTQTLPFYASSALLAPGLQTFAVQAGLVRRNWGQVSNDYRDFAAAAAWRRGLSNTVTVEASLEGTRRVATGGAGIAVNLAGWAVLNGDVAASAGAGRPGATLSLGLQRVGRRFSLALSETWTDARFRDVAAVVGQPAPRRQETVSVGVSFGAYGSAALAYARLDQPGPGAAGGLSPGHAFPFASAAASLSSTTRARILTASYSVRVGKASLYASGFRDFASRGGGAWIGLTIPLGSRSSTTLGAATSSGSSYFDLQAEQEALVDGQFGYQAYASSQAGGRAFLDGQYRSPWGSASAGVQREGGRTLARMELEGALSTVDGAVFASNRIGDSFAVAKVDGTAGVRVYDENREIGRTDRSGRLLVPDLRAFDVNRISIEPTDVPPDIDLPETVLLVRPQDRSGVVAHFQARPSRSALLRLVDEAGAPTPVGSTATLLATGQPVPVGYDGAAYVTNLGPTNVLEVTTPDGRRCRAPFAFQPRAGDIPAIGPLTCRADP